MQSQKQTDDPQNAQTCTLDAQRFNHHASYWSEFKNYEGLLLNPTFKEKMKTD